MKPRDIAEQAGGEAQGAAGSRKASRWRGPGFLNMRFAPAFWQAVVSRDPEGGRRLRPRRSRPGRAHQRRIRVGQSDRSHARRPLPRRGVRRRARQSARRLPATTSRASTTSTMPAPRSTRWHAPPTCATARRWARISARFRAGLYPGDYLKPVGAALAQEHGPTLLNFPEERWLPLVRDVAIAAMLVQIKEDLAALDVSHDVFFSERSLTTRQATRSRPTIEELRSKGLVFEGRLEKPKGHDDSEWEDREQTLFKSTAFGDDVDRALMKSDGSYTYFAADMAYHHNKLGARLPAPDQRVRRRPRRLHDARQGGGGGAVGRQGRPRHQGVPAREAVPRRRAGAHVQARRHLRHAARGGRRGRPRPRAFHDALSQERRRRSISTWPRWWSSRRTIRCSTCSTPMRGPSRCSARCATFPELYTEDPRHVLSADLSLLNDAGEIDLIKRLAAFPDARRRAPRAPTSRTGWLSISMIWLRLFMANGQRAMICHICALFNLATGL